MIVFGPMLREWFGKFEADVLPATEGVNRAGDTSRPGGCQTHADCPLQGRHDCRLPGSGGAAGYRGVRTVRETTERASARLATPTCAPRTE